MGDDDGLAAALGRALARDLPEVEDVTNLRRLSGGASQETWSFDAVTQAGTLPLILRRRPGGARAGAALELGLPLETEARLIRLASRAGVPAPGVRCLLEPGDGMGSGFVMDRVEGETIPRRILRDPALVRVRSGLARRCGEILARIHAVPRDGLPELPVQTAAAQLEQYRSLYEAHDHPHPVFELAFRFVATRLQAAPEPPALGLVHGDFRNGNLMIGPDGVRAVLDWELSHVGDPMEDLGWICVNSWRFGEIDKPVGGFGPREELFEGYEAGGGGPVEPERVRFWEILGTLKWGILCSTMYAIFRSGADRSIERAAIGRRASETEIDLLQLLEGEVASRGGG